MFHYFEVWKTYEDDAMCTMSQLGVPYVKNKNSSNNAFKTHFTVLLTDEDWDRLHKHLFNAIGYLCQEVAA